MADYKILLNFHRKVFKISFFEDFSSNHRSSYSLFSIFAITLDALRFVSSLRCV